MKPQSKDLSHFLSDYVKGLKRSKLKEMRFDTMHKEDVLSLGGGLPLPSLFPFEELSFKSLAPPFKDGIDADINTCSETLDVTVYKHSDHEKANCNDADMATTLQYGVAGSHASFNNFVKQHMELVHDIGFSDWALVGSIGNTWALHAVVKLLCNPGDVILTEEFTFASALENMEHEGAIPIGAKMDLEGLIPEALREQLTNWVGPKPKFLYTIPTGQNPTGSTLSAERRQAIYDICVEFDLVIVEDEPYYYLQMDPYNGSGEIEDITNEQLLKRLAPSFLNYDYEGRVIRLDSVSKVLAPGTRLGWIVCNPVFATSLNRLLEGNVQNPSGFSQSAVNGLLQRWGQQGYLTWLCELRKAYTVKRDATISAIEKYFPKDLYTLQAPTAGMFFWIKLDARKHKDFSLLSGNVEALEMKMYRDAIDNGVLLVPGHWFKAPGATDPPQPALPESEEDKYAMFFRGTFASVPTDKIVAAMERWAKTMSEHLEI